MKTLSTKLLAMGVGAAALCATALPAAAGSFTQPGATTGVPAGANPPPGLYFGNAANWGQGIDVAANQTESVGVEVPFFIWSPGWNFLGASYAASVAFPLVEVGIHNTTYLRGVFNPAVNPIQLSWNLGNGLFVSFGEVIYVPINTEITIPSANTVPGVTTSAASFEQRVAISYIGNDWIASANGYVGIVTKDSVGNQGADYVNVDLTLAHTFGKWELGVIGYYAADINTTVLNAAAGKNEEFGVGGLLAYNFGPVDLTLRLTHEFITKGSSNYGKDDTRVWTTVVIPIWNPTPPAPRPIVAKY